MSNLPPIILQVVIPSPLAKAFDYLPPKDTDPAMLKPGMRLKVPFGPREAIGFLVGVAHTTDVPREKLKFALTLLDQEPLIPASLLKLYRWASDYYHTPLGNVIAAALPPLLRKGRFSEIGSSTISPISENITPPTLNEYQQQAVDSITATTQSQPFLLWGITGSGKTEVYLRCVEKVLENNQQALILIPEIGLTPQTLQRFQERFSTGIVVLHSHVSAKKRMEAWLMAKNGQAKVIIGTRSAIFTPLAHPGIIIVDEEHDTSFKQQTSFRYSARDLAVLRGAFENIPVILGSATPSLETLYNVERGRYRLLSLPTRTGSSQLPTVQLVDIRGEKLLAGISNVLLQAIDDQVKAGGQVLLFLNRRGYAPTLLCHACGFVVHCDHCDARLTLHHYPKRLYCHHCGFYKKIPPTCGQCQQNAWIPLGLGTERLESYLQKHFPHYHIIRIDRDNTRRKGSMAEKIAEVQSQKAHILIGTQMIAKGHHFPHLSLAAIVNADSGLFGSDFRATEKMGQLLQQVGGRAGRERKTGTMLIQTHYPEHPVWQTLIHQGYDALATILLKERKAANLPPFTHMALLRAQSTQQDAPLHFLTTAKEFILNTLENIEHTNHTNQKEGFSLLGPIPATMEKKAGNFHYQLLLQSVDRTILQRMLKKLTIFLATPKTPWVRWVLDVDPQESL
jgi:primosomal protein N' (replication factor Y)